MKIEHVAIWTFQLEELKDFYVKYFKATANEKYTNSRQFESYFLSFDEGCRMEIMRMPTISEPNYAGKGEFIGFSHFAISVGDKASVIALTEKLRSDGYPVVSEPRTTGDGYFESVILDPDGNRIEITI